MSQSHVLSGLIAKHEELAGQHNHHVAELTRLDEEIAAIGGAIRVFDPQFDMRTLGAKRYHIKKGPENFFKHNECYRLTLDALREANGRSVSTTEVIEAIVKIKNLRPDKTDFEILRSMVWRTLEGMKSKGTVTCPEHRAGSARYWQLA